MTGSPSRAVHLVVERRQAVAAGECDSLYSLIGLDHPLEAGERLAPTTPRIRAPPSISWTRSIRFAGSVQKVRAASQPLAGSSASSHTVTVRTRLERPPRPCARAPGRAARRARSRCRTRRRARRPGTVPRRPGRPDSTRARRESVRKWSVNAGRPARSQQVEDALSRGVDRDLGRDRSHAAAILVGNGVASGPQIPSKSGPRSWTLRPIALTSPPSWHSCPCWSRTPPRPKSTSPVSRSPRHSRLARLCPLRVRLLAGLDRVAAGVSELRRGALPPRVAVPRSGDGRRRGRDARDGAGVATRGARGARRARSLPGLRGGRRRSCRGPAGARLDPIGRSGGADVRLDDPTVSRRHALGRFTDDGDLRALDDRSLNGLLVNGESVEWAPSATATSPRSAATGCTCSRRSAAELAPELASAIAAKLRFRLTTCRL